VATAAAVRKDKTMATNIKITDNRYGDSFRTGVNGLMYDIPLNTEVLVEDALADHIRGLGVAFEEPRARGAKGEEGGAEAKGEVGDAAKDVLRPVATGYGGGSAVEAPAMKPKSLNSGSGSQPGDVTGSAAPADDEGESREVAAPLEDIIAVNSAVSDVRVKGERRTHQQGSVAEIAGEGEGGTTPAEGAVGMTASSSKTGQLRDEPASKDAARQERVAPKNDQPKQGR
jgi:hypothetical protein